MRPAHGINAARCTCPANGRSCKHDGRLPGLSHKKTPSPAYQQGTMFTSRYHPISGHPVPCTHFCANVCCTDIRLTAYGRHAFRRKAPILKVPEGSCGMLSAGGAPSLTHYIFCTHVCSQPESVLVLHSSGVLSSCRFSWFSFMNDTSLYDW